MNARLVVLGLLVALNSAQAQWRIGVDLGVASFAGTSKDTSGATPNGSFRPLHPTTFGLRVDRRVNRFTIALAVGVAWPALALQTDGASLFEAGAMQQYGAAAEIGVDLVHFRTGAVLAAHGGPLAEVWTLQHEDPRYRLGGQAGLSLEFPLGRRVTSAVNARVGVTPSMFTTEELPPEFERRPSWRRGVSIGLRYKL